MSTVKMRFAILTIALLLAATTVEIRADVIADCAGKPADVIFVLDASNSIWRPDFQRQLDFIKALIELFTIGSRNIMIGVITYARHPQLQFHLNSYNRKSDLLAAIDIIRQDGGYETMTSDALRYLRQRGFNENFGARSKVAQVAVVITDGRSDNTTLTALEAAKVKAAGVHLFAVGVGRNLGMEELRSLASEPTDYYTFLVDNYSGLERIKDLLAIKTCSVTNPPSTTTTITTPTTTTISTTITRRPRRTKTRQFIATTTTTTTSEPTTAKRNDDGDGDGDDDYYVDYSVTKNRTRVSWKKESGHKDSDPSGSNVDQESGNKGHNSSADTSGANPDSTGGQKNFDSSSKTAGSDSHLTGNNSWSSSNEGDRTGDGGTGERTDERTGDRTGNGGTGDGTGERTGGRGTGDGGTGERTGNGGAGGTNSETGKDLINAGSLEHDFGKHGTTLEDLITGQGSSGSNKDGNRPTIGYESFRTPEILQPPEYVPDSTPYHYHELQATNLTYKDRPESKKPGTLEHEGGTGGEEERTRRRHKPGSSLIDEDGDGNFEDEENTGPGIYEFNTAGKFVRRDGSESLVDPEELPEVPEKGDLVVEGGLILTVNGRRIIGCVIQGKYYIGKWMGEDGKNVLHGYIATPEIEDRIQDGSGHQIETAEHRIHDNGPTDGRDSGRFPGGERDTAADVDMTLINFGQGYNEGSNQDHGQEREEDQVQVLDPSGNSGYYEKNQDGILIWYLYTCPGVYVPVPDGPPLDENGQPQLNGHSECAGQDENGQEVVYQYDPSGTFKIIASTTNSGLPDGGNYPEEINHEDNFHELVGGGVGIWEAGQETGNKPGQGGRGLGEGDQDQTGTWRIDLDGSKTLTKDELVDLKLPKIDEDQEFYVKENVIWAKDKSGKVIPVGCIINGTYYVGYWVRKDDGSQLLYGYPSKFLKLKLTLGQPNELTPGQLKDRSPVVDQNGNGQWIVGEDGIVTWFEQVTDSSTPDEKQEFRRGERDGDEESEVENTRFPGHGDQENINSRDEIIDGRKQVLDSNGQTGEYRPDGKGGHVWHHYICPGVYKPVPDESTMEEEDTLECTVIDENGQKVKFEYESPGNFRKIPAEDSSDKKRKQNMTKDSKKDDNDDDDEEEKDGDKKAKHGSDRKPDPEFSYRRTTSRSAHGDNNRRTTPMTLNGQKTENGAGNFHHRGCRPRKPTDLAFIIDSKRDDETTAGHMWNLTRDILSKLDLNGDRIRVRFVQECGPGTEGLDLGEFSSKESLIRALDSSIHAPPTSSAQLIRNMAEALSRDDEDNEEDNGDYDDDDDNRYRGNGQRRRVGIYMTDGPSDEIEEMVEAAQGAKHDEDVELFAVGVGGRANPTELRAIASCEVDRHYYALNHHSKADAVAKKISKVICLGR